MHSTLQRQLVSGSLTYTIGPIPRDVTSSVRPRANVFAVFKMILFTSFQSCVETACSASLPT